jgi:hypothetical protein
MIFDSADLLRVPWEVVAKEFRSTLGTKSFNDLDGYAAEFFAFLNENTRLFPLSVQKDMFLDAARTAAVSTVFHLPATGDKKAAATGGRPIGPPCTDGKISLMLGEAAPDKQASDLDSWMAKHAR